MYFEWDEEKNRTNQIKHKISFEKAIAVFFDEERIEEYDYKNSVIDEDRYNVIGRMDYGFIIVVTCIYVSEELIRIISARKATRKERDEYYDQKSIFRRS